MILLFLYSSQMLIQRPSEISIIAYANLKYCSWGLSSSKKGAWTLQMAPERWGTVTESRLKSTVYPFNGLPIPSTVNSHYQPPTNINSCLSLQSKAVVGFPQVLQQSARAFWYNLATSGLYLLLFSQVVDNCGHPGHKTDPPVKVWGRQRMHSCNLTHSLSSKGTLFWGESVLKQKCKQKINQFLSYWSKSYVYYPSTLIPIFSLQVSHSIVTVAFLYLCCVSFIV